MHTALGRVDIIRKRDQRLVIAVGILQRDLGLRVVLRAGHVHDLGMQLGLVAVVPADELADAALVAHGVGRAVLGALIGDRNMQTGIQERLLPHPGMQDLIVIFQRVEHLGVGLKGHAGAVAVGVADDLHFLRDMAAGKFHLIDFAFLVDLDRQPLGQGVDDRRADAVQAAGNLVAAAAEFTARVQNGVNDLERGPAGLRLNVDGNAAAVVGHGDGIAGVDRYGDVLAVARKRLVDGVIDDFVDQMVQAAGGGGADIHTGALPHRLQALENLDL